MEEGFAGIVFLITFCYGHVLRFNSTSRHKGERVQKEKFAFINICKAVDNSSYEKINVEFAVVK